MKSFTIQLELTALSSVHLILYLNFMLKPYLNPGFFLNILRSFISWYNCARPITTMLYPSLSTMCFWSSSHQEMESAPPVPGPGPASWLALAGGTYLKYTCDSSGPRPIELPCVLWLPLGSLSLPLEQVWPSLVHNERPSERCWVIPAKASSAIQPSADVSADLRAVSQPSQDQPSHTHISRMASLICRFMKT